MPEKIPQNIGALVGDIGEQQVLLRLALFAHASKKWQVYRNVGETGYDILLVKKGSRKRIAIEVKTRQKIFTTSKRQNVVLFFITPGERKACNFLVGYFLDRNDFYIVPKKELKLSWRSRRYLYFVTLDKQGNPAKKHLKYLNNWSLIDKDFDWSKLEAKLRPNSSLQRTHSKRKRGKANRKARR